MVKHAVLSYKADPTEGSSEKANKIKIQKKKLMVLYNNEYASIMDIYFYEYFHLALALQNIFRHPV